MTSNPQLKTIEVTLDQRLSRLVRKYSGKIVSQALHEIRTSGEENEFLRTCGWKPEMTLQEALACLQEYCDFLETMIQEHLEKDKPRKRYVPALFN